MKRTLGLCVAWWVSLPPFLVNEDAVGPKVNPFKQLYEKQFGGKPKQQSPEKKP